MGRCHTRNFVEIPPQVRGPEPLKANNNNDVSVVVVVIVIAVVVVVVVVVVLQCPVAGRNALPGYGLCGGLGEVSGRSADGLMGGRGSRTELKNGAIGFSTGW